MSSKCFLVYWEKYAASDVVGNMVNTLLWVHNLHPLGPFIHKYRDKVMFNMGINSLNAGVALFLALMGGGGLKPSLFRS